MDKTYNFGWAQCWHSTVAVIFEKVKIKNALEFGLGDGTEYLLDNVDYLLSVELSVSELNKDWTEKIQNLLKERNIWKLEYVECPQSIIDSNILIQKNQNQIDDKTYLKDLHVLIDGYLTEKKWDLVFVDPGIHHRGDIVNRCMEKDIDIILAHDTKFPEIYGYSLISNDKYHKIEVKIHNGTTIWINKNYQNFDLIVNSF